LLVSQGLAKPAIRAGSHAVFSVALTFQGR